MESEEEAVNTWKININDERKYWKNYVLKYYILFIFQKNARNALPINIQ